MTPEERLAQLEQALRNEFGCHTRYLNQVFEAHGTTATVEQRVGVAEAVIRAGNLGIAAHQFEVNRRERLGRPMNTPD